MAYIDSSSVRLLTPPRPNGLYTPPTLNPIESHKYVADATSILDAKTTYGMLAMYLRGELRYDPSHAVQFFSTHTLRYIKDALEGYVLTGHGIPATRRAKQMPNEFQKVSNPSPEDTRRIEAFHHMETVFGYLQGVYGMLHPELDATGERSLVISPTPDELFDRMVELHDEIGLIVSGETAQDTPVESRDSLFRTHAFFLVAHNMGDRLPKTYER